MRRRITRLALLAGLCAASVQPVMAQAVPDRPGDRDVAQGQGAEASIDPFQPQDDLERSLWAQMDEAERDLRTSSMVIDDPELNAYVRSLLCRLVGEQECQGVRLYIMRTPHFNASMAANGAMQVWSGLLLRTQNEAQLAAVLAHEFAHFERRHSVELFRHARNRSNSASWLALTGVGLIASFAIISGIFNYSREMEREADLDAVRMLADAGYDTREIALIWEQIRDEMDATAEARGRKSRKDKDGGLFASHPPTAERVEYLRAESDEIPGTPGRNGNAEYQQAMASWLPVFLDDQLKTNDYGASAFLLDSMGKSSGQTAWLEFARAELLRRNGSEGDQERAVEHYDAAIAQQGNLPEIWRGRGLALLRLGRDDDGRADLQEYLRRAPDAPDRGLISMMTGEKR